MTFKNIFHKIKIKFRWQYTDNTWVSQKFCNILVVRTRLPRVYHVIKAVPTVERYLQWVVVSWKLVR